jgi:hypothetical protein
MRLDITQRGEEHSEMTAKVIHISSSFLPQGGEYSLSVAANYPFKMALGA